MFGKRPRELTREDIQRAVDEQWQEGAELELKSSLPTEDGNAHPWTTGGNKLGKYARNELLAEVVAFANAYGGWLLLGVKATDEKPERAKEVEPIPRCTELGERLGHACRDCIDPRHPLIEIEPVVMRDDGAGVVVFHVPRSRMAPHRLTTTLHCYRRHADRTEKMTMREIQDLTLQVERGIAAVDRHFEQRRERFSREFRAFSRDHTVERPFGLRATLAPLTPLYIQRVHGEEAVRPPWHELWIKIGSGSLRAVKPPVDSGTWRPLVRGTASRYMSGNLATSREVHCNGLIEYRFAYGATEPQRQFLPADLVVWMFGNAVCAAERFRRAAGVPDVEYGLEFEVTSPGDLWVGPYGRNPFGDTLGPFPKGESLPRYVVGPIEGFQELGELFDMDFWNAAGVDVQHHPLTVDFERALQELGIVSKPAGS